MTIFQAWIAARLAGQRERRCGRSPVAASAGCAGRRPRARRPGRPAAPGRPGPAAAAVPGSGAAGRSPAATGCSWRCRSLRDSSVRVTPRCGADPLEPRADLVERGGDRRRRSSTPQFTADSRNWQHSLSIRADGAGWTDMRRVRRRGHRWRRRRTVRGSGADPGPPHGSLVVDAGTPRNAPAAHMQGSCRATACRRATCWRSAATRCSATAAGSSRARSPIVEPTTAGFLVRLAGGQQISRPPAPGRHRTARRAPRHPRAAGALGARRAALPLLPRLRGPRPAARRAGRLPETPSARADRPAVVRRRRALRPRRRR